MSTDLPAPSLTANETCRVRTGIQIRQATGSDDDAIRNLVARCPEAGAVSFGFRMLGPIDALLGRFPTTRIHVACGSGGLVVGMLVSEMAHMRVSGRDACGARVSFLRTDPAFQRQGIAGALLQQAEHDARAIDGVAVLWGHIMDGNRASHATFARAGYRRGASGRFKLVDPRRCPAPPLDSRIRIGRESDLPWLVSALDRRYAGHDFWRTFTAAEYGEVLGRWLESGGSPRLFVLAGAGDEPVAAALAYGNGYALVHHVERMSPWLRLANLVMRLPIELGRPLRLTTVADVVADPAAHRGAAAAVARHAIREQRESADFVMLVRHANEVGDEAWRSARGVSSAVDVVFKGTASAARPSYIEPW